MASSPAARPHSSSAAATNSSSAAAPNSSSVYDSPTSDTLNSNPNSDTLNSDPNSDTLNSEEPSTLPQSAGNSSPLGSPSLDTDEDVIIINEGVLSQEDGEEEEEECPFCIFMKGGGCKEQFIAWEKCVEDADKLGEDVVDKCMGVTSLLKICMEENAKYYEPLLRVEREMADAASDVNSEKPEKEPAIEAAT